MKIDLKGMTVLVTGGSSGIGERIALSLSESNARVALHFNTGTERAAALVKRMEKGSAAFRADLADPDEAARLFGDVVDSMGRVDALVNNAGIFECAPASLAYGEWIEIWKRTLAVNLTSSAVLCHAAIRHFREHSGGRIVNIASRAAFRGETRDYLPYAASKGGMVSLSRSIARSFGKDNIKSFVIAPGFVRTPMAEGVIDEDEVVRNELALGEMTTPDHIAPLAVFMCSGAMDHATGCSVDVNAGSYMR